MNRLPQTLRKPLRIGTIVKDPSGQGWRIGAIHFSEGERTYMTVLDSDEHCIALFGTELEEWHDGDWYCSCCAVHVPFDHICSCEILLPEDDQCTADTTSGSP